MRLVRLRLNGFKSFVDPTELAIAPGLTGIVGPNGCGKSNLLEALRWVMGEGRPTAMRGEGMEDVIFAGAARRAARSFAEVALTIDNAERRAPAGFNDAETLEIVRRITRDGGSTYRANGREVRARDVQMLFADAATGATSPALVRQGQVAELIAARPRARRRVLEDAAGIAGLYARRHEAEQRLAATEANLARIADVLEALGGQLAQLSRQAKAAARYREIGEALRRAEGLLLLARWRAAAGGAEAARAGLEGAVRAVGRAEAAAAAAARARAEAEAALPPLREEAAIAAAVAERLAAERGALAEAAAQAEAEARAAAERLAQLDRDLAREEALVRDAGETTARLAEEAARLARADEGQAERLAAAAARARAAAAALETAEAAQARATEEAAALAARHQSAARLVAEARAARERAAEEAGKAAGQAAAAEAAAARAAAAAAGARTAQAAAQARVAEAEATLAETEAARAEAQAREGAARAARAQAEGELAALRAEAGALQRLVAREAGAGGQLLDALAVTPGWEGALGAALADDLRAPLARPGGAAPVGWAELPAYPAPPPLPEGAAPLAAEVRGPPALARRLSQVGVVPRALGPRLQPELRPGQRLVSPEGDLWRWDGYFAAAGAAEGTAALRLRQLNRLATLKDELAQAEARAAGAAQAHEALKARAARLAAAEERGREARRAADRAAAEAARALARAEADEAEARGRGAAAQAASQRFGAEAAAAAERLAAAEAAAADLPDLAAARAAQAAAQAAAAEARAALMAARAEEDGLRRAAEGRARRAAEIARERQAWADRLASAGARRAELEARRARAAEAAQAAAQRPAEVAARTARLAEATAAAEGRRTRAAEALAAAEARLRAAAGAERQADRAAAEAREGRAGAEAALAAAAAAEAEAAARLRAETGAEPAALAAALGPSEEPPERLEAEVGRLRRAREALGAVNLRAEEDAAALRQEHATLEAEKDDLAQAVARLRGGIGALNREGRERLLTAFEQVNAHFGALFTHLFGGGEARLALVESDDPLEAGLEILCQPPGKKLSTLTLLSGGEQTLTALALIFAVFLANPAPICVLDEVDAPLDDANVGRFCDLVDEMARRTGTRFLIITHHAVTMARMDRLYGVTMAEPGVSQLVSVDLRRAEALVA